MHATARYINTAHCHAGELLCSVSSPGAGLSSREWLTGLSRHGAGAPGRAEHGGQEGGISLQNHRKKISLPGGRAEGRRAAHPQPGCVTPSLLQHQLFTAP